MIDLNSITGLQDLLNAKNDLLRERLQRTSFSMIPGRYNTMAEIYSKKYGIRANVHMNPVGTNNHNLVRVGMDGVGKNFSITKNIKLIIRDLTNFFDEYKPVYDKKEEAKKKSEQQDLLNEYQIEALDKFLGEHTEGTGWYTKEWQVGKYFELTQTSQGFELHCKLNAPENCIELLRQLKDLK